MEPELLVALLSLFSTLSTNQSNRQLSAEQRDWSESMQDKQNAYNTPSAQVQRLREAGFSPNSASMGNGLAVSGNTSASPLPYQVPQMLDPMSLMSNSVLQMMSGRKAEAERKTEDSARDARINEIKKRADQYEAQTALLGLDAVSQQIANEYAAQMYEMSLAKGLSEIGVNEEQAKNLSSLTDKNLAYLSQVLPKELQLMADKHQLNVLDQEETVAQIQKLYAETELTTEQQTTELGKQQLLDAQTVETQKRGELEGAQASDVKAHVQMYLDKYDEIAEQISAESKLSKRQVKGFWINTILHGVTAGAAVGGATAAVVKAAAAL